MPVELVIKITDPELLLEIKYMAEKLHKSESEMAEWMLLNVSRNSYRGITLNDTNFQNALKFAVQMNISIPDFINDVLSHAETVDIDAVHKSLPSTSLGEHSASLGNRTEDMAERKGNIASPCDSQPDEFDDMLNEIDYPGYGW